MSARAVGCGSAELVGGPWGEGLPSLPPEFAGDLGFLGGWWPRGAAGGEEAESPPRDTKVPGAGVETRALGGWSGRGRGAAGSLETREAARGWVGSSAGEEPSRGGAGRHKAPGSPLAGGSHP